MFYPAGGEVHLEMLRASCLIAAAITFHSILLFYGHNQLWSSLSPFGASLETSASIFIYNLRARPVPYCSRCVHSEHAMIQPYQLTDLKESRNACVVALSMNLCAHSICVPLWLYSVNLFKSSKTLHFELELFHDLPGLCFTI